MCRWAWDVLFCQKARKLSKPNHVRSSQKLLKDGPVLFKNVKVTKDKGLRSRSRLRQTREPNAMLNP